MIVTLNELKGYLRIDSDDDDEMLKDFIKSAEKTCGDILRKNINQLDECENAKVAVLYAATYIYEHREKADYNKMNMVLRALLFGDRSDEF